MYLTNKGIGAGVHAPDFMLKSLDGHNYRLSDYRGRSVILFFVRETRQPDAAEQIKEISNFYSSLNHLADVLVIIEEDPRRKTACSARDYAKRTYTPFPVLSDPNGAVLNQYSLYKRLGFDGYQKAHSSVFLINSRQEITYDYVGEKVCESANLNVLLAEAYQLYANVQPRYVRSSLSQTNHANYFWLAG